MPKIRRWIPNSPHASHMRQQQGQADTHLPAWLEHVAPIWYYGALPEEAPELGHELESSARSHRWNFENST